jgi:hypothetical protein
MRDRYCASCGRTLLGRDCCWVVEDGQEPRPGRLIPPKRWEEWDSEARFLVTVLMGRFGGAAEEWELLCRLPWDRWRLASQVFDADNHEPEAAELLPCARETDERGRGTRYFVTDLARASYEAHRLETDGLDAAATGEGAPSFWERRAQAA